MTYTPGFTALDTTPQLVVEYERNWGKFKVAPVLSDRLLKAYRPVNPFWRSDPFGTNAEAQFEHFPDMNR